MKRLVTTDAGDIMMTTEAWNEQNNSPDLADKLARLRQPDAYPERPESIEVLETHMSWLFLTKRHVYKMRSSMITTLFLKINTHFVRI